jgi:TonB family protein
MATRAQTWQGPSRRRSTRFRVQAPLDVTVLRSGVPDTVPGRSVNLCERGIAAVLAAEIKPGEVVGIEVMLPSASDPLRSRALVRYQDKLRCGMEFVGLSPEQRTAIREWADRSRAETDTALLVPDLPADVLQPVSTGGGKGAVFSGGGPPGPPKRKRRAAILFFLLLAAAFALGVFWWRWNHEWEQLESGLPTHGLANDAPGGGSSNGASSSNASQNSGSASQAKVQAEVPTEVMQRLLLHKVDPVYPAGARKDKLQGVIVLDLVVGRDGSVIKVRPQNGPDLLAQAAVEAVRWWKFEPYRMNGEPAVVGTRIAVEFKP